MKNHPIPKDLKQLIGESTPTFGTHDLGLIAALLIMDHELLALSPIEKSKPVVFHFVATPRIDQDVKAYMSGKLPIDAKHYWEKLEGVKTLIDEVLDYED